MDRTFRNVYDDDERADAYSRLEFPGTYYLAFRDLPAIFSKHVTGTRALDFGCGTGRSTRFLKTRGFDAIAVDISVPMLAKASDTQIHALRRHLLLRTPAPAV
jgi:trans-aconitate methyltransferase